MNHQEFLREDVVKKDTWFAPAGRSNGAETVTQIKLVTSDAVVSALLKTVPGLMAVLNENRQILAVNDGLLKDFNIPDPHKILGLRLGEAVNCVHAADHSGGCGTGKYCATCGAAIAIVAALASNVPEERRCILKVTQDEYVSDICLSVKAVTMDIDEAKFVLLFLQDMTEEEKRVALERVFFHDLNNIVMALAGLAEVASFGAAPPLEGVTRRMTALCKRLVREVQIQKALVQGEGYQLQREVISVADVVERLRCIAADLPHAQDKKVVFEGAPEPVQFVTDLPLLERVLTNMIINALEETAAKGAVVVSVAREVNSVHFNVWNDAFIPEKIAMRIFQRYFTTKEGRGRGFGTYSMKYFGEHYLGGTVSFTTSHAEGTVFTLVLPLPHSQE